MRVAIGTAIIRIVVTRVVCPMDGVEQQTTCPDGWTCALKSSGGGACHFEYPPEVPPHRENCYGCRHNGKGPACEPNLPNVPASLTLPNVLVVGDSVSHGYFPLLAAMLNGTAHLQHAPSNTGNLAGGVSCFNVTTLLGGTADAVNWDLITFNFGLHDTYVPTPPPMLSVGESLGKYMGMLKTYTSLVQSMGAKGLFVLTTPYMKQNIYEVVSVMNRNASEYMTSVGVPIVDLYSPVVDYCGSLPYTFCDICEGSTSEKPVDCRTTPHYTEDGYRLLASTLATGIREVLQLNFWAQIGGSHSKCGISGREWRVQNQAACQAAAVDNGHRFYSYSPLTEYCKTAQVCDLVQDTTWDWMSFSKPVIANLV